MNLYLFIGAGIAMDPRPLRVDPAFMDHGVLMISVIMGVVIMFLIVATLPSGWRDVTARDGVYRGVAQPNSRGHPTVNVAVTRC